MPTRESRIRRIITHPQTHLDEYGAIFLARRYGDRRNTPGERFIGIRNAPIEFWSAGGTPDGRSAEDHEREGSLLIGVGGGRFDEHPSGDMLRKQGESAATLMAKALGVERYPEVKRLLEYIRINDTQGNAYHGDARLIDVAKGLAERYTDDDEAAELLELVQQAPRYNLWSELAEMVRKINQLYEHDPKRAYQSVMTLLEAEVTQQRQFHRSALPEFRKNAVTHELPVTSRRNRPLKFAVMETDTPQVKSVAMSSFGGYMAAYVQRGSSGNTQIFVNKFYHLDMGPLVAAIRRAELMAAGLDPDDTADYTVDGDDELGIWHYFTGGQMLLNGSLSHPDVTPTRLSLEQVVELVREHLRPLAKPSRPTPEPAADAAPTSATADTPGAGTPALAVAE